MLHAYVQRFDVTVTMQKFLALFISKQALKKKPNTVGGIDLELSYS
jgi:hypothetical protein